MTISLSDNTPRISYTVDEGATQTAFTVPFEFFAGADLNFYVDGTKKTITTHYTVTGGDGATGTINTTSGNSVTGASGGSTVIITRSIALERTTDFPISGGFEISSLNTELDRFVGIQADLQDGIDRGLHLADDDTAVSMELPLVAVRKGTVLGFNATTGAPEVGPTIANVSSLSAITANISTVAGIASDVTTVAGIDSNVTTVAGVASNVTTVAGNTSNINSVVSNATNINTVAGSISNVNSVGGSIADVNTIAGISSDVTAVAADATDIGVVAGKATEIGRLGTAAAVADLDILATTDAVGDMNTLAAISSNITTVANIASNVTSVAGVSSLITSDFVSDLNTLATTDIVSDLNTLATADIVTDLNTLATSDIVSDINTLATSDIVSDINTLATSDIVSDLNTLATSDIVTDLNLLATSAIVEDLNLLATSSVIADMATLAGSGANPNITTLTASGAVTAGSLVLSGDATFGDDDKAIFGDDSDLQIYHDGSNSIIKDAGTGNLQINAGSFVVNNAANNASIIVGNDGGSVNIYHNGSEKIATTSTGVDITGTLTSDGLTVEATDSDPNVIIGNSGTGDATLTLRRSASDDIYTDIKLRNDGGAFSLISDSSSNDDKQRARFSGSGDISFYDSAGSSQAFYWDASAESLGIGTTSPLYTMHLYGADNQLATFESTDANANIGFKDSATTSVAQVGIKTNDLFFATGGSEAMRIDSSNRVGINSVPNTNWRNDATDTVLQLGTEATLHSDANVTTELWNNAYVNNSDQFKNISERGASRYMQYQGNHKWFTAASASAGSTITEINTTPKMILNASGNLGIGTTLPSAPLQVQGSAGEIRLQRPTASQADWSFKLPSSGGELTFYDNNNSSEAMRIDSSGNVGIGVVPETGWRTSNNEVVLQIDTASIYNNDGNDLYINSNWYLNSSAQNIYIESDFATSYSQQAGNHIWYYAASGTAGNTISFTEAMRIDSSGNLLVGKTTTASDPDTGMVLQSDGVFKSTSDGSRAGDFNRGTSDGEIVRFSKDGSGVGSIGSEGGDALYIQSGTTSGSGLHFKSNVGVIRPARNGATVDNAIDLGADTRRFKDLYLSGGAYLGGTGAANKLDDYEEGTWTPAYTAPSGVATYGVQTGSYTKVGNKVTVIAELQADRNTLSGLIKIGGLPFSSTGTGGGFYPTFAMRFGSDMSNLKGYVSGSELNLRKQATNAANSTTLDETDLSNAGTAYNYLYFTATYFT